MMMTMMNVFHELKVNGFVSDAPIFLSIKRNAVYTSVVRNMVFRPSDDSGR